MGGEVVVVLNETLLQRVLRYSHLFASTSITDNQQLVPQPLSLPLPLPLPAHLTMSAALDTKGSGAPAPDASSTADQKNVAASITSAEGTRTPSDGASQLILDKPVKTWRSYIWDTLDKSPAERKFLFKLDAILLTMASLGYFIK